MKTAQREPSRRSALLSRADVATSSAGVAESRSGPRNRAVRRRLPSLFRTTPGATSAAQGRKSARRADLERYSARRIIGSDPKPGRVAQVSARHLGDLRIPLGGPNGEEMTNEPECEAHEPKTQAQPNGGRQGAIGNGDGARRTGQQDRIDQGAVHRREIAGNVGGVLHQISAPPPKEKKDKKKLEAAKAMDSPKTICTSRRNPPELSPKASVRPVTMMMITATILATGPSIDSRMVCKGASQGMPDPAASAGSGRAKAIRPSAVAPRAVRNDGRRVMDGFLVLVGKGG